MPNFAITQDSREHMCDNGYDQQRIKKVESVVLKDHLGSWTTITDYDGGLEQELSFAAWGNLRDPETWSGEFEGTPLLNRGFTGHEHLYNIGIINMNGRMYDPMMSSFLSVDSYVQAPDNSQNFNRYAYCLNNPLKYVDPSGEELCAAAVMAIAAAVSVATQCIQNYCYDRPIYQDLVKAAAIGAVQGMFSYGIGYVGQAITAAMEGAGRVACIIAFKAVAHGTLAGAATVASGGHFWQGFASGAASSLVSSCIGAACAHSCSVQWQRAAMIAGGALAGGVSSTMAGGSFWDGVCNGLICSGLNHAMHLLVEGGGKDLYKQHKKISVPRQHGRMDCKYAVMEGVAKNFGDASMTQSGFKTIGNLFIKNNPNITMTELFRQMGFMVMVSSPGTNLETMFTAMDRLDFPIAVEYSPSYNCEINHIGVMESLSKNSYGELIIQLSDPYFGDNHIINPYSKNNCYYQFYGYQSISNMLNEPIKGLRYY